MKYDAILYDMDGTVLDTLGDLCDSVNYALSHFSLPAVTPQAIAQYLGNGAKRLITLSCPEGTDEATAEKVLAFYMPWYNEHCRIKTAPYDGILEMMRKLKTMGVKQAVISNKPDSAVQPLAEEFFSGLLELAVGESKDVRRKPAPDSVLAAAKKMNVPLDRCVYIGDTEVDIETAKNAGMDCISVTWGFRSAQQLAQSGATVMVNSAEELFDRLTRE